MRALALVLATSCAALVAACAPQDPTPIGSGGASGGSGATGTGSNTGTGAGAGSGTGSGVDPGTDPMAFFDEKVKPILAQMCDSCHAEKAVDQTGGPDFLGVTQEDYYAKLVAESRFVSAVPEQSYLLTKGAHLGPAFAADQYAIVLQWLQLEAAQDTGGGGGVFEGPTGVELIEKFAGCMTLEQWTENEMQTVALQPTQPGTPCASCHASGTGANYMTNPNTEAGIEEGFINMSEPPLVERLVTFDVVTGPNGNQHAEIVQSYRWRDKGNDGSAHPKYVFQDQQPKLDAWFNAVITSDCFIQP
jgi:hypothetical protein